jgi:hypothetical protein
MYIRGIRSLFRFQGYVVSAISMSAELVQVNLRRDGRFTLRCPACGAAMGASRRRDTPTGRPDQPPITHPGRKSLSLSPVGLVGL